MSEFSCWFYLDVITKDGEVRLCRYVDLPFPPVPGQSFYFDTEFDYPAAEVGYSIPNDVFWIECGNEEHGGDGCRCGPRDGCCTIDTWVKYYVEEEGWEIDEKIRKGEDRLQERSWMFDPDKTYSKKLDREFAAEKPPP